MATGNIHTLTHIHTHTDLSLHDLHMDMQEQPQDEDNPSVIRKGKQAHTGTLHLVPPDLPVSTSAHSSTLRLNVALCSASICRPRWEMGSSVIMGILAHAGPHLITTVPNEGSQMYDTSMNVAYKVTGNNGISFEFQCDIV